MGSDGLKKEILVVGFGAVGAIYSYILMQSGRARVSVVARSNYEVVNREGLHIKSGKYGDLKGWKPDAVYKSIADAATQVGGKGIDYVVVATKAIPELTTTPQLLEPLLSRPYVDQYSQPVYVLLQNGLGVEKDLYEAIRAFDQTPKIASAAVWIGTNLVSAGVVEHGSFDRVTIGMYRHQDRTTTTNSPEEQSILDDIGGMLGDGGSQVTIVPEIQRMKFAKNFWNVIFSSVATLTRYTLPAMFRPPPPSDTPNAYAPYRAAVSGDAILNHTIPQLKAVFEELMVLGRALGYPDTPDALPSSLPESILNGTMSIHEKPDSSHKPSMMLDMERGQPLEVEVILGEVVRMAQEVGVGVPRVEMMYALLLVVQNQILRVRQNS
ncbi:ketopantoate reductase PanE/ApbA-domain-containing protein [Coprinopsis sp. MPI-PUGE-AT-0042]|nr:ketopantoate reductase PanE/ApbA-domain-containing protein [Coprinopsis sp. MPI-PUGE-AT-0042]